MTTRAPALPLSEGFFFFRFTFYFYFHGWTARYEWQCASHLPCHGVVALPRPTTDIYIFFLSLLHTGSKPPLRVSARGEWWAKFLFLIIWTIEWSTTEQTTTLCVSAGWVVSKIFIYLKMNTFLNTNHHGGAKASTCSLIYIVSKLNIRQRGPQALILTSSL